MLGERGSIFKHELRDMPIDLVKRETRYNTLWGKRYFVYLNDDDKDYDYEFAIENMLLKKFLND